MTAPVIDLYTDGGVIGRNPSAIGGTWAWIAVDNDTAVASDQGLLWPTDVTEVGGLVTNNVTELLAIVDGLEAVGRMGLRVGKVYSDSWVSLLRVFVAAKLNQVPPWLVTRLQVIRWSGMLAGVGYVLLDGHPTRAQLAAGVGKRGGPVSKYNVACDQVCTALAANVKAQRATEGVAA